MAHHYDENNPRNATKKLARNPLIWIVPVCIGLTALFAPVDVLDRIPKLNAWCAELIHRYPFLGRLARQSSFPQVTRLVVCMTAVLLWVHGLLCMLVCWQARKDYLTRASVGDFPVGKTLFAGAVLVIMVPGALLLGGQPSRCDSCLTHSRWIFSLIFGVGSALGGWPYGLIPVAIYVHFMKSDVKGRT